MPYYRCVGDVPRKRHQRSRRDGAYLFEELVGTEGFAQDSALLYHLRSPSALVAIEPVDAVRAPLASPDLPLTPRHLRTPQLPVGGDPVTGRHLLLANDDVRLSWVAADQSSPLYRNAVGDELVFVHRGTAELVSVFGRLRVGAGDYVVVPAGTTHQWRLNGTDGGERADGGETADLFVLDGRGHIQVPERYLTARGQFREGSPYSERDVRGPSEPVIEEGEAVPVLVRNRAGWSRHVHACHPFDVVGWDGCFYPWAFSIHDFEPLVGHNHQPPPVHQTFAGQGFVVCSFVPRLYDFGPEAAKVPYHHANVDSDEVLYYAGGNFMSRRGSGIGEGSISFHPAGFTHGPQPGSMEAAIEKTATDELAVMVDTFKPLGVTDGAREISDPAYPWSWARPSPGSAPDRSPGSRAAPSSERPQGS